jgi:ATP/maltotriose-dependent transcriptional regulator MalT
LRFTREESDRLVDARIAADAAAKLALHERSGGWAAGLVLMIEHHRHAGVPAQAPGDDAPQTVFD